MITLLQRVARASVETGGETIADVGRGILVLVAFEPGDTAAAAERIAQRIIGYRIFNDDDGRMNRCVADVGGAILLVPQFTLAADTRKGTRPGFSTAAAPEQAETLFAHLAETTARRHPNTARGRFGADMRVELVNEGPATFLLRVEPG